MKEKVGLALSFVLAGVLLFSQGNFVQADVEDVDREIEGSYGMMGNHMSEMMKNVDMSKMMKTVHSAEGQEKMIEACTNIVEDFE